MLFPSKKEYMIRLSAWVSNKHMNASSLENRDKLCSWTDNGYTFVILPLVPDRLYIERGRGDWAGTGRFRH